MAERLPSKEKEKALRHLEAMAPSIVETHPEKWTDYCLQPFQAVDTKGSPVYAWMKESVEQNLDYQIETNNPMENGSRTGVGMPMIRFIGKLPDGTGTEFSRWKCC